MDGLHGASKKWILLGRRLRVLRVNLASQAVTAGVAVLINPLRHPIPIILGHYARQSAPSPGMTQALVKEIHTHPMEWLGEPDLRF